MGSAARFKFVFNFSLGCQNVTALEERGSYSLSELGGQNFQFTSSAMLNESLMIQVFLDGTTTRVLINMRSVERGPSGVSFTQSAHWVGSSSVISEVLDAPKIVVTGNKAFALFVGKSIGFVSRQTVIFYVPLVSLPSAIPTLQNESISITPAPGLSETIFPFSYTKYGSNKDVFSLVYQAPDNGSICLYHNLKFFDNASDVRDNTELLCLSSVQDVMPLIWEDRLLNTPQFYMYYIDPRGDHQITLCSHVDKLDTPITCQPETFGFPKDITVVKTDGVAVGLNLYYIAYLTDVDLQVALIKNQIAASIEYTKPVPVIKSNKVQFKLQANDDDGTVTVIAYNTEENKVLRAVVGAVIPEGGTRPELGVIQSLEVPAQEFLDQNIAFSEIVPSFFSMTVAKDIGAATTFFYSYPYCGDSLLSAGEFCDSTKNCKTDCTCFAGFEASAGFCVPPTTAPVAVPVSPPAKSTDAEINVVVPAVVVPVCAAAIGTGLLIFFLRRRDKKNKEKKEQAKIEIEMVSPIYKVILSVTNVH